MRIQRDNRCREEGQAAAWSHTARQQERCWVYSFPAPSSPCAIQSLAGRGSPTGPASCWRPGLCNLAAGLHDLRKNRPSACSGWGQSPLRCSAGLTWPPQGTLSAHSLLSHRANLSLFSRVPVSSLPPSCLSPPAPSLPCLRPASHTWLRSLLKVAGPSMPGDLPSLGLAQPGTAAPEGRREMECGPGQESCW